ncbi:MAG: hypothetical protein ACOC5E_01605 [Acidobacteriota bacterium]
MHQRVGDRSLLPGLEHRWFFADDVLNVASLGLAAFVDSGYAWPRGPAMELGDLRTDVGVSLLIGRTRLSTADAGMRIDVAYALDPVDGHGRWLLSFGRVTGL